MTCVSTNEGEAVAAVDVAAEDVAARFNECFCANVGGADDDCTVEVVGGRTVPGGDVV